MIKLYCQKILESKRINIYFLGLFFLKKKRRIMEAKQRPPVSLFLIGYGQRGSNYAKYALEHPEKMKLVAVAEPRKVMQEQVKAIYGLSDNQIFDDWRDVFKKHDKKIADCALIALQDQDHHECAIACANAKYDIILEKPMAVNR